VALICGLMVSFWLVLICWLLCSDVLYVVVFLLIGGVCGGGFYFFW